MTFVRGRALSALLLLALCGCKSDSKSSAEQIHEGMSATRDAVRQFVPDVARQRTLLAEVDELERLLGQANAELSEGSRRLQALNAGASTECADLERVARELTARRRAVRERALNAHFSMIASTTPEEWEKINEREMEALGAALQFEEN